MKSSPLSRSAALSCIPIRNPEVVETRLDTGEIRLDYPEPIKPWFEYVLRKMKRELGLRRVRKIQLDSLGSCVWNLVDGKTTVNQLIDRFSEKHRIYHKEAEISVVQFLRELGRRGIIGMKQVSE